MPIFKKILQSLVLGCCLLSGKLLFSQTVDLPVVAIGEQQLQVHPSDHGVPVPWGPDGVAVGATSIVDGQGNTLNIVNEYGNWSQGHYAANVCALLNAYGYDDWYLPSATELAHIWEKREEIGGFSPGASYWSSTEEHWGSDAAALDFTSGIILDRFKDELNRVRCVRRAPLDSDLLAIDDVWVETSKAFYTKYRREETDRWLDLVFGLEKEFKSGLVKKLIAEITGAKFLGPLGVVKTFFDLMPTAGGGLTSDSDFFLIKDNDFIEYSRRPSIYYRQQAPVYKVKEGDPITFLGFTRPEVRDIQSLPRKLADTYFTEFSIRHFDDRQLQRQWQIKVFEDEEIQYVHSFYLSLSKKRLLLPVGNYTVRWGRTVKTLVVEPESHDAWRRHRHKPNATIKGPDTNIYSHPDFTAPVTARLKSGDKLFTYALIESVDDLDRWIKVECENRNVGYVHQDHVVVRGWNDKETSGTFTDPRDGQTYRWVRIGDQVWMAENLRYLPSVDNPWTHSRTEPNYYVYDYFGTNVKEAKAKNNYRNYGVLYNEFAAMKGQSSNENYPGNVQGACPSGWKVPSDAEWTQLANYVVSQGYPNSPGDPYGAGHALKSCRQVNSPLGGTCDTSEHPRWGHYGSAFGFDAFGFAALPAGKKLVHRGLAFMDLESSAYWWSSTLDSSEYLVRHIYFLDGSVRSIQFSLGQGFSLRCIRAP